MSKHKFSIVLTILVLAMALMPQIVAADNSSPVNLTFSKQAPGRPAGTPRDENSCSRCLRWCAILQRTSLVQERLHCGATSP